MSFIKWDRPRGTVHNVAKALELASNEHCNVLLISDAALYVIQNWVALDLEFKARWADEIFDHGYTPISEESADYAAWVDLIEQIQGETVDMSCEIVTALETINSTMLSIKDSIDAMATEQGAWDDLLTDLLLPLAEGVTGADMLQLTAALRDQQVQCCDALADRPYYPVPPDPASNPETSTFCQRADSFATNWYVAAVELFSKAKTVGQVGLGIVSIIVAALSLPVAVIVAIVAAIAGGIAELTMGEYEDVFDSLRDSIRCAIYTADSAEEAKAVIDELFDAQLDGVSLIDISVMKYLVSQEALNAIFLETYPILDGAISNCSDCFNPDCLVVTSPESPYNELLQGDSVEGFADENVNWGWRDDNGGEPLYLRFYFTPTETVSDWHLELQTGGPDYPSGFLQSRVEIQAAGSGVIYQSGSISSNPPAWADFSTDQSVDLAQGVEHFIQLGCETFNEHVWFRVISLCPA